MGLICPTGIFLREGLDRVLTDLPVGLICRSCVSRSRLRAKQISSQFVGWAKRQRAHHQDARSMIDGGDGAGAPLPTLRRYTAHCVSSVAGFDADFDRCALEPIS